MGYLSVLWQRLSNLRQSRAARVHDVSSPDIELRGHVVQPWVVYRRDRHGRFNGSHRVIVHMSGACEECCDASD